MQNCTWNIGGRIYFSPLPYVTMINLPLTSFTKQKHFVCNGLAAGPSLFERISVHTSTQHGAHLFLKTSLLSWWIWKCPRPHVFLLVFGFPFAKGSSMSWTLCVFSIVVCRCSVCFCWYVFRFPVIVFCFAATFEVVKDSRVLKSLGSAGFCCSPCFARRKLNRQSWWKLRRRHPKRMWVLAVAI